ncbi:hypothetical protein GCM10009083_28340 [Halopseudomonas pertucinogena]|uniref:Uncharacterized protein n=1 Tax=Halopseudomonas pertucinogena TaxID=86175 RepID=A0ABQ2CWU5_9GAMM|nr:hypothetical protein GCM10009083_28340 [Halopseudomonas pertucinogena]
MYLSPAMWKGCGPIWVVQQEMPINGGRVSDMLWSARSRLVRVLFIFSYNSSKETASPTGVSLAVQAFPDMVRSALTGPGLVRLPLY